MNTTLTPTLYTPEDLLAMPDGKQYELVDGQLQERNMGVKGSWVSGRVIRFLGNCVEDQQLGWVLDSEASYQCYPRRPKLVRRPDVSFIRRGRLPDEQLPEGHARIPPDLAVEVVSPNDLAYEIDRKILEYLDVGVPLVWEVNPDSRVVWIHRPDGTAQRLREQDELTGENVVPGFRCSVRLLFEAAGGGSQG